jgi:hypothetical protein
MHHVKCVYILCESFSSRCDLHWDGVRSSTQSAKAPALPTVLVSWYVLRLRHNVSLFVCNLVYIWYTIHAMKYTSVAINVHYMYVYVGLDNDYIIQHMHINYIFNHESNSATRSQLACKIIAGVYILGTYNGLNMACTCIYNSCKRMYIM